MGHNAAHPPFEHPPHLFKLGDSRGFDHRYELLQRQLHDLGVPADKSRLQHLPEHIGGLDPLVGGEHPLESGFAAHAPLAFAVRNGKAFAFIGLVEHEVVSLGGIVAGLERRPVGEDEETGIPTFLGKSLKRKM